MTHTGVVRSRDDRSMFYVPLLLPAWDFRQVFPRFHVIPYASISVGSLHTNTLPEEREREMVYPLVRWSMSIRLWFTIVEFRETWLFAFLENRHTWCNLARMSVSLAKQDYRNVNTIKIKKDKSTRSAEDENWLENWSEECAGVVFIEGIDMRMQRIRENRAFYSPIGWHGNGRKTQNSIKRGKGEKKRNDR